MTHLIEPDTAVELYLTEYKNELSKQTVRTHRGRLSAFLERCEDDGIESLINLVKDKSESGDLSADYAEIVGKFERFFTDAYE